MSMKKHRARQGGHAETHLDTDDQKHLREVVLEELEVVMRKHKCGGVVLINSFESAAWRYVFPEWGGFTVTKWVKPANPRRPSLAVDAQAHPAGGHVVEPDENN